MFSLAAKAYLALVRFDGFLMRRNFAVLYDTVRHHPKRDREYDDEAIERICSAVDLACIWYWKQVLCLQRSAVTAYLLKDHGVPAQMVIGARHMPFKAHAWVEVAGRVVNDRSYTKDMYAVLDRC